MQYSRIFFQYYFLYILLFAELRSSRQTCVLRIATCWISHEYGIYANSKRTSAESPRGLADLVHTLAKRSYFTSRQATCDDEWREAGLHIWQALESIMTSGLTIKEIYKHCILPVLIYSAETWSVTRTCVRRSEAGVWTSSEAFSTRLRSSARCLHALSILHFWSRGSTIATVPTLKAKEVRSRVKVIICCVRTRGIAARLHFVPLSWHGVDVIVGSLGRLSRTFHDGNNKEFKKAFLNVPQTTPIVRTRMRS